MSQADALKIFNQSWTELYCPPVRLALEKDDQTASSAPLSVVNGVVYLKPDLIPRGCDPNQFLLWYFRHELAHVHHCPYDINTAYSLEKAAQQVMNEWSLAYLATHVFSDMQVNFNYLPRRFGEIPYTLRVMRRQQLSLAEEILREVYLQVQPAVKSRNKVMEEAAKEILTISSLNKPWHVKVQMIAMILKRLKTKYPKIFSESSISKSIQKRPISVREDFLPDSIKMFEETYGTISNPSEAKEFFKQWIEPRLSQEEREEIEDMIKEKLKTQKKKGGGEKERGGAEGPSKEPAKDKIDITTPSTHNMLGKEPHLPTSLSKPYTKVHQEIINEAFWKRYWYKSRAEKTIIQYLADSPSRRPVWSVMKYPDEWYIEDEIEALDVEMSLDEGPLIPEVTTLKWVEEATPHGQSVISGFVPSAIVVLDASYSMLEIHDDAAIAAFIAYLSARKAGGHTSLINFSTGYVAADWNVPEEVKELTLSMSFNEFTIFPAFEVMKLASSDRGSCFIVIITDGGWQNVDEAVPLLERIADLGHKVFIFQLPGGEYPDRIEFMKGRPLLKLYKVSKPEVDLQNIVLSEAMKTYKTFLT